MTSKNGWHLEVGDTSLPPLPTPPPRMEGNTSFPFQHHAQSHGISREFYLNV